MKFNLKLILLSKMLVIINVSMVVSTGYTCFNNKDEEKGRKLNELNDNEIITNPMVDWKVNYEKTIEFLKKHEGFAGGKAYICPGGYKTIGYGHVIQEGEQFEEITEKQADSLLRVDFNQAIKFVNKTVQLSGVKRLAIAHFVFTKGIGTFVNSGLKDRILRGQSIDSELLKMCYYTNKSGEIIRSEHALNIRKWELYLYHLES